ncbi:collagen-binding domain-containing protein [Glycomyces halotolerans]
MSESATLPRSRRHRLAARLSILGAAGAATAMTLALTAGNQRALAEVVTISPLDPALGFNAFVEGDTSLTENEMEGPLATGGDLTLDGLYEIDIHGHASFVDGADALPSSLVVGGQVDFSQSMDAGIARILSSSYVKVGDLTGTDVLIVDQNGASVDTRLVAAGAGYESTPRVELAVQQPVDSVQSSPIDFASAFSALRSNSEILAACASTVAMMDAGGATVEKGQVLPGQQIRIELAAGQTNVLEVTGEDLDNMSELDFVNQPSETSPLLINVDTSATGGVFSWDVPTQAGIGGAQAPYILWNFNDATAVTLVGGDTVEGSVYAPNADFTDLAPANVEGQIVAANAALGTLAADSGELHHFPFAAELTCDSQIEPTPPPTTTEVPTTEAPTTDAPTTYVPTTEVPTTDAPTSEMPTSASPPPTHAPVTSNDVSSHKPIGFLPSTGTSIAMLGLLALALIGGGAAAVTASRKRRQSTE